MATSVESDGQQSRITFSGDLTIYKATELWGLLVRTIDQACEVELDLGGVEEIDTAGVQLLMMAKRLAAGREKAMRMVNHSQSVLDVFELFNLGAYFGDPVLLSARGARP